MAKFVQTVALPTGRTLTNAYARIEKLTASKEIIEFDVLYYYSKEVAHSTDPKYDFEYSTFHTCPVDDSEGAPNYRKQAYLSLANDPKLSNAVDDLDEDE